MPQFEVDFADKVFTVAIAIVALLLFLFCSGIAHAQGLKGALPEAPKPKAANRIWLAEVVTLGGLYATDATLTARSINANQPEGHPFFYGTHPSPTRIGLQVGALWVSQAMVLRFTEHSRSRRLRWIGRAWAGFSIQDEVKGVRSWIQ